MKINYSFILFILFMVSCSSEDDINDNYINAERGKFLDDWSFEFFMDLPNRNAFKLWVPENTKVKAILVLAPGGASDGSGLVQLNDWQEYARKENLALLGVHVRSNFISASRNLIYAVNKISEARGLDYISKLPFLLKGFSHGGVFSYNFAQLYRDKTIAYSDIKGPIAETSVRLPPGLFIAGAIDPTPGSPAIYQSFLKQRESKAIACFVEEPNEGHAIGNSDIVTRAFFSAILKERFVNIESELIDLEEDDYFLGDNSTFQYEQYEDFLGEKEKSSCLINEEFIEAWLDIVE